MKVVLELQDQLANVRRITVRHDIVIGRGSDCNLRLSSPQVSRRHCFLRVGRDGVSVTDLDSSNGTYLNGQRIPSGRRAEVADGARLALGPVQFLVSIRSEVVTAELPHISSLDHSVSGTISREDRRGATSVPSSSDLSSDVLLNPNAEPTSRMKYSIEHAGEAAGEDDPTTGPEGRRRPASSNSQSSKALKDLEVELIDGGQMKSMKQPDVAELVRAEDIAAPPAAALETSLPENLAESDEIQIVDDEVILEEEFDEDAPLEPTAEDILNSEDLQVDDEAQPAAEVNDEVADKQSLESVSKDSALDSTWFSESDSPDKADSPWQIDDDAPEQFLKQ